MIQAVVGNTAAGSPHPADPNLRIQHITVVDPNGLPTSGGGAHVYGYDGNGNIVTDTWTIAGASYVKTYAYTGSNLTSESDWVKQ